MDEHCRARCTIAGSGLNTWDGDFDDYEIVSCWQLQQGDIAGEGENQFF